MTAPTDAPVKTAVMTQAAVEEIVARRKPSAEELEEALAIVTERRLAKVVEERRLEEMTNTDGFKHFWLANPVFPGERILIPGTNGQFYGFYRGRILIDSAMKEALIRSACDGRIYEEDLKEPRKCRICQTQWFSSTALAECQLKH
jgi:hypothetical protein